LPAPYATKSVDNGPELIPRPANAWPQAPAGFKVQLYADGLENPRLIRTAPNGDVFLAESAAGEVKVFRGITASGKAEQVQIFATGLNKPFGIAFSPLGPNPEWVYVANTDSVVRFPYRNGDLKARRTAGSRAKFAWWRALARWRPLDSRYRIFTRRQEDVRIGWIAHQRRREQ
jgi:glucose/arabinose dehydrogenase